MFLFRKNQKKPLSREQKIKRRKKALNNVTINDVTAKGKTRKLNKEKRGFSSKYMENIEEYPQTPYDFLCIIVSVFSLGELDRAMSGGKILKPMYLSYIKKKSFWKKDDMVEYSFTIQDQVGDGMTALNQYVCEKENQSEKENQKTCFDMNGEIMKLKTLPDPKIDIEYYTLSVDFVKTHIFEYKDDDNCDIFSFQWGDDNNVTLNVFGNEIVQGNFYFYYTYKHPTMTLTLRVLLPKAFQTVNCNIKF